MMRGERHAAAVAGELTYYTGRPCARGHDSLRESSSGQCLQCKAERDARVRVVNREEYNARKARERTKHRAQRAADAKLRRDTETPDMRIARLERAKEKARQWRKDNPKHHLALTNMHKHAVRVRTPAWADRDALVQVYKQCPAGHQVDHIVPLRGALVSGLNVPWNLQYLTPDENRAKSNRFDPLDLSTTLPV